MVIRPTGINHLREVSSWGPTYPPPRPAAAPGIPSFECNSPSSLSLFALSLLSPLSSSHRDIMKHRHTRSSKWILYQLSSSSPLFFLFFFFTSHCSNLSLYLSVSLSLHRGITWTLVGVQERNKGSLRLFTMTTWSGRKIPRIFFLSLQIGIHSDSSNRSFDPGESYACRRKKSNNNFITVVSVGRPTTSWNVKFVFQEDGRRRRSEWRVRRSWDVLN